MVSTRDETVRDLVMIEQTAVTPAEEGIMQYVDGAFIMKDSVGDFDPREMTSEQHEALRQLIHYVSSGPTHIDGAMFTKTPCGPLPTLYTWWTDDTQTVPYLEVEVTRAGPRVIEKSWRLYATDGSIAAALTDYCQGTWGCEGWRDFFAPDIYAVALNGVDQYIDLSDIYAAVWGAGTIPYTLFTLMVWVRMPLPLSSRLTDYVVEWESGTTTKSSLRILAGTTLTNGLRTYGADDVNPTRTAPSGSINNDELSSIAVRYDGARATTVRNEIWTRKADEQDLVQRDSSYSAVPPASFTPGAPGSVFTIGALALFSGEVVSMAVWKDVELTEDQMNACSGTDGLPTNLMNLDGVKRSTVAVPQPQAWVRPGDAPGDSIFSMTNFGSAGGTVTPVGLKTGDIVSTRTGIFRDFQEDLFRIDFDGTADYVDMSALLPLWFSETLTQFSIVLWTSGLEPAATSYLFSADGAGGDTAGVALKISASELIEFSVGGTANYKRTGTSAATSGEQCWVFTYDGGEATATDRCNIYASNAGGAFTLKNAGNGGTVPSSVSPGASSPQSYLFAQSAAAGPVASRYASGKSGGIAIFPGRTFTIEECETLRDPLTYKPTDLRRVGLAPPVWLRNGDGAGDSSLRIRNAMGKTYATGVSLTSGSIESWI